MRRRSTGNPFSLFSFQDIITGLCGIMVFFVLVMLVDLISEREAPRNEAEQTPYEAEDNLNALKREIASQRESLKQLKEATRRIIVASESKVAPEKETILVAEMNEKEREAAALDLQIRDRRMRVAKARDADAESRRKVAEMGKTRRLFQERLSKLTRAKGVTLILEPGEFKAPIFIVCGRDGVEVLRPIAKRPYRKLYPYDDMVEGVTNELSPLDRSTHTVILLIRPSGISLMDTLVTLVKGMGFSYGRDPLEEDVDVDLAKEGGGLR